MEDAEYFQDLDGDSTITLTSIREEIRDGVKAFIEPIIPISPMQPSSPLSSIVASVFGRTGKV